MAERKCLQVEKKSCRDKDANNDLTVFTILLIIGIALSLSFVYGYIATWVSVLNPLALVYAIYFQIYISPFLTIGGIVLVIIAILVHPKIAVIKVKK